MCLFFETEPPVFVGAGAAAIATADLGADGLDDVLVADRSLGDLVLLAANGTGGFSSETLYGVGGNPTALSVFTPASGPNEVAVLGRKQSSVTLLKSSGGGLAADTTFQVDPGTSSLALVDTSGSGTPDLVTANFANETLTVYDQLDSGAPELQQISLGFHPASITGDDLNGDGKTDVIAGGGDGVAVLLADPNGSGELGPAQTYLAGEHVGQVIAADLNGDHRDDLVVSGGPSRFDFESSVSVLLNNGQGGFGPPTVVETGYSEGKAAPPIAVADLNGDGKPDIVVGTYFGLEVLLGNGHGGFGAPTFVFLPESPIGITVARLSSGHLPEIVATMPGGEAEVIQERSHPVLGASLFAATETAPPPLLDPGTHQR